MDVVVIGGGVIGLAVAWRIRQRGPAVTVVDPSPGQAASFAAAGMLAPVTEQHYGEETLLELRLESSRRWPEFVADLEAESGLKCGYRTEGTLAVALDAGDRAVLAELAAYQRRLGLTVQSLSGRECRRLEPMLAADVTGGVLVEQDRSVDPRRLVAALLQACRRSGVAMVPDRVVAVESTGGSVDGVLLGSGELVPADVVVLAAGTDVGQLAGVPAAEVPVRPVKGEVLRPRVPEAMRPLLTRSVRGVVTGQPVYLVPRVDGELVIGATSSEESDLAVKAGGVYALLRDARSIVPAVDELPLMETTARLRPGTPDNAPIIGELSVTGIVAATGHYRNGILLTPVTADAIAALVVDGAVPDVAKPFCASRFDHRGSSSTDQEVTA